MIIARTKIVVLFALLALSPSVRAGEIHDAAKAGNLEQVKQLLAGDRALINTTDEFGRTPLHWACRGVHFEVVKYLVENGADVSAVDVNGIVPLSSVASRAHLEAVTFLIDNGARLNDRDKISEFTALHYAALKGQAEVARLLVDRGADVEARDIHESTPLHVAVQAGQTAVVELLLNDTPPGNPASVNVQDYDGYTPLQWACDIGNRDIAALLVAKGADMNARNTVGQTAFNLAGNGGYKEIADLLAQKGADQSPQKFPILTGPYLGQTPPGMTPQLFAKGIISTRLGMHGVAAFSPSNDEVIWAPDAMLGLLFMKQENGAWSAPAPFPFMDGYDVDAPCYSYDGTRLLLMAGPLDANGMVSDEKIYCVDRQGKGWSEPRLLDSAVNSIPMHFQFSIDRQGNIYTGGQDIYCARLENGRYHALEKLPSVINTDASEMGPFISKDGDYLIFNRVSPPPNFSFLLLISFKDADGNWTEPQNLGSKIPPDEANNLIARVSPDGRYLFFLSKRTGSPRERGVYWVDARVIDELRPKQ
jgi:ankyrin repeat protein